MYFVSLWRFKVNNNDKVELVVWQAELVTIMWENLTYRDNCNNIHTS
jgi:hypothetical protein